MTQYLSRLEILETLNVRNLPQFDGPPIFLDIDYLLEGLGTQLVEERLRRHFKDGLKSPGSPRTLGLGAAMYGNVRLGTYQFEDHKVASILRLRIFHIEYHQVQSRAFTGWVAKLHLIAQGAPADAEGYAHDLSVFQPYWLDGPIKSTNWDNR